MEEVSPDLVGNAEMLVGTIDTAPRVGSGAISVLATPVMINLMEETALDDVEHLLLDGMQSLGTHLDISHMAATMVGMKAMAVAELVRVEDRKLFFNVSARDEFEEIGGGRHELIVVSANRSKRELSRNWIVLLF